MKRKTALLLAFVLGAAFVAAPIHAQQARVVQTGTINGQQVFPWLDLPAGQTTCNITVNDTGSASSLSAIVETTGDGGVTKTAVTSIGTLTGASSATGSIVGTANGLSQIHFNVSSFTPGSGVTKYYLTCVPGGSFTGSITGGAIAISSMPPVSFATPCGAANTFPCPAKTSPPGFVGTSGVKAGGATTPFFYDSWPDTLVIGANQTAANTYEIVAGVANQNIYLWQLSIFSTGTNTAATVALKIGSTANCSGAPAITFPGTLQIGATAGINTILVGAMAQGSASAGLGIFGYLVPALTPLIVVSGATPINVCITTVSATESWQTIAYYGVRAN